jgi:3-isopropylmalate/(R)-2-methylmalate dehydratase large subunit
MVIFARKLLSKACEKKHVTTGEVVVCKVGLAVIHFPGGSRRVKPVLERLSRDVWDKDKAVIVTGHYVPVESEKTKAIQPPTREWVHGQDIKNFYDQQGIYHVVVPECGHLASPHTVAASAVVGSMVDPFRIVKM